MDSSPAPLRPRHSPAHEPASVPAACQGKHPPASPVTLPQCLRKVGHVLTSPTSPSSSWASSPTPLHACPSVLPARGGRSAPTARPLSVSHFSSLLHVEGFLPVYVPHPTVKWGPCAPPPARALTHSKVHQERADAVAQMLVEVECC